MEREMRKIDRISILPDETLLHILSFLPTIEATPLSILSKRWRFLPRCLHVLDFELPSIMSKNFINQTLDLHDPSVDIQRFRLDLDWEWDGDINNIGSEVDKWISKAFFHNVQELDLLVCVNSNSENIYELPECVFTSRSLRKLELKNCIIKDTGAVSLPSLKFLCLEFVDFAGNETMQHLMANCVALKEIYLRNCSKLESLQGKLLNLKFLDIEYCEDLQSFNMEVPNLQLFKFISNESEIEVIKYGADSLRTPGFNFNFGRLVTLSLTAELSNDMLQLLISKCPLLEELCLQECTKLNQLTVCNHNFKKLELIRCAELNKIDIDAQNLRFFKYVASEAVEFLRMGKNPILVVELLVGLQNGDGRYNKFKNFLQRFHHVKDVSLCIWGAAEIMLFSLEIQQNSFPPLYNLRNLELIAAPVEEGYEQILVGLLSLSVHLEFLSVWLGSLSVHMKFKPQTSANLENFSNKNWSSLPLDHLQRRLMEVKIMNMQGDGSEKELVEFLCRQRTTIDLTTYTPSMVNWSWEA